MSDDVLAVGIDLGTTNCALAWATGDGPPQALPIPQVVAAGELAAQPLLPSFLFVPAPEQFAAGALALPWYPQARDVVGSFARSQGATTPARLVASAKSWLSHAGVDRQGEILPWQAPDEVPKCSPVQAAARYLGHLRAAWEQAHPDTPLEEQDVVLTVPASFDAVARELTVQAAMLAGFEAPTLLEEPQAAMYDWLAQHGDGWRTQLAVGDVVLVVDIGGGTTDFSLIAVREDDGVLALERIAVGDHILLGGDNIDLALAHAVRAQLEQDGTAIDEWQMRALTHACRGAKESLLGDPALREAEIAIAGRGSRLIGNTVRATVTRAQIDAIVLEGFLPLVDATARPQVPRRVGLQTVGLPYPSDAAITRHLAAFLARGAAASEGSFVHPTAILFNGGVTRASTVRARIVEVLTAWLSAAGAPAPKVLAGTDADLAVCRGAAHYAQVRRHGGVRIKGGTVQSYYVGIERVELAVPGVPPRIDAVCVAPFGMEEGSACELPQLFALVVGEEVTFRFFGSSIRKDDRVGAVVPPGELVELSPIETTLPAAEDAPEEIVQVRLQTRVTEVGTLDLAAVEHGGAARRWRLSFDVRGS
ncbi:MAG: Hsp70 family protein [Deltaproteobacteria bacterium]|nr:Hsp70 family protein [Deltaproteobacteria bacterium]